MISSGARICGTSGKGENPHPVAPWQIRWLSLERYRKVGQSGNRLQDGLVKAEKKELSNDATPDVHKRRKSRCCLSRLSATGLLPSLLECSCISRGYLIESPLPGCLR